VREQGGELSAAANRKWRAFVERSEGRMRVLSSVAVVSLISLALAGTGQAEEKRVTWTGWFSDVKCASARLAGGTLSATNPECSRRCIEGGAAAVFISEQAKAVFAVQGYPSVVEDLGYHMEVQGALDEAAKTLRIEKVTRLEFEGAACARPKKK
jgi:hypothetical protein